MQGLNATIEKSITEVFFKRSVSVYENKKDNVISVTLSKEFTDEKVLLEHFEEIHLQKIEKILDAKLKYIASFVFMIHEKPKLEVVAYFGDRS